MALNLALMPEAPEVETIRRALVRVMAGCRVARVVVRRRDLRYPVRADIGQLLEGRRIEVLARRGKALVLVLESATAVLVHLGMSGRFVVSVAGAEPHRHEHLTLILDTGVRVGYVDPRRFGWWDVVCGADWRSHTSMVALGPEADGLDGRSLRAILARTRGSVRTALLNQRLLAGLGNIYVSEALWRAGIAPARGARDISLLRCSRLAEAMRAVLAEATARGGSTLRDYRLPSGASGQQQDSFAVYGRDGGLCLRCAGVVRRRVLGGRASFACGRCQR